MINVGLAVQIWTFQSPFDDHFVPDGVPAHNLALCLVILPNTNNDFQVEGGQFLMHIFSVVVIYMPKVQKRCMLLQAVEHLAQLGKSGEFGLVLVRLSHKLPYLQCLADKDKIDYAVTPVDCDLYKDIGHPEEFAPGCLLCLEGVNCRIHVVMPPAFRLDPKSLWVTYKPTEHRGTVWANVKLVDNDGENLLNDVAVAEAMEYCNPQMDEVRWSGLGLEPLPIPGLNSSLPLSLARTDANCREHSTSQE